MRVERPHARVVRGRGAEADESVRPHQDGAPVGHAQFHRLEPRLRPVDDRDEIAPALAEIVKPGDLAEHHQIWEAPVRRTDAGKRSPGEGFPPPAPASLMSGLPA